MTEDTDPSPPRQRRKQRPPLTRPQIVAAAFRLLDEEGEAALSMRRLAAVLGCEAMSLYHHLPGIEALADALVDALFEQLELPAVAGDPAPALKQAGRSFLALAERHPHVVRLVVGRRWTTPLAFARVQALVGWYRQAGAAGDHALRHARVLGAYLGGAATALAGWRLDAQRIPASPQAPQAAAPGVDPGLWQRSTQSQVRADLEAGLDWLLNAQLSALSFPAMPGSG